MFSALYCVLFVLDASVPPDQPRLPFTTALAWYLCAPFFAGYLVLGVAVADDPLGFLMSGHALWDLASFVPYVVASMPWAAASVLAALGVTYGEVSSDKWDSETTHLQPRHLHHGDSDCQYQ